MEYSDFNNKLNSKNKDIYLVTDIDAVKGAITNLLSISKVQVPGRPDLGTKLESSLFEIMDETTFDFVEELITEAIEEFEPRVDITNITFTPDYDQSVLLINLNFKLKTSRDEFSLSVEIDI